MVQELRRQGQVKATPEYVIYQSVRVVGKDGISHIRCSRAHHVIDAESCRDVIAEFPAESQIEIVLVADNGNYQDWLRPLEKRASIFSMFVMPSIQRDVR